MSDERVVDSPETGSADSGSPEIADTGHVPASEETAAEAQRPEFSEVTDTSGTVPPRSLARFLDVEVTVSAELGRVTMPLGRLVELGEGSVVELNRSVASPVDLMAQGRRIASGEVVVINDCFAIRIQSVENETPENE